jgi:hypothetical protein
VFVKHTIGFHRDERAVLQRAMTHITIAYPDLNKRDAQDEGLRAAKAVRHFINGTPGDLTLLNRAHTAMRTLYDLCAAQSEYAYWQRELNPSSLRISEGGVVRKEGEGVVGLVSASTDICAVLAETRQTQAAHARAALEVLEAAFAALPADDPVDPDDDVLEVIA